MRAWSVLALTMLTLGYGGFAFADSWPRAKLISHVETVQRQAPVSGGYIRGLEVINSDEGGASSVIALDRLFVPLRPHGVQTLCLQISTRDGGYLGSYEYQLPSAATGSYAEIDISTSSEHPEYYRRASPDDMAVIAYAGSCAADNTPLIPVFWNSPPIEGGTRTLVVAVQSGDRDVTLYWGGKKKPRPGWTCQAINQPGLARFDSLCRKQFTGPIIRHETAVQVETCSFGDCGIVQSTDVEP